MAMCHFPLQECFYPGKPVEISLPVIIEFCRLMNKWIDHTTGGNNYNNSKMFNERQKLYNFLGLQHVRELRMTNSGPLMQAQRVNNAIRRYLKLTEEVQFLTSYLTNSLISSKNRHKMTLQMYKHAKEINSKVNYISQYFSQYFKIHECVLPTVIQPKSRTSKPGVNHAVGITYNPMDPIATVYTVTEFDPEWMQLLTTEDHDWVHNIPSAVKADFDTHVRELVSIHKGCVLTEDQFANFPALVGLMVNELRVGKPHVDVIVPGNKNYSDPKYATPNSVVGRCPCHRINGTRCTRLIEFTDDKLVEKIRKYAGLAALSTYDTLMSSVIFGMNSKRIKPTCPNCNTSFTNLCAISDAKHEPVTSHPQHVVCPDCSFAFCTDCLKPDHPTEICNGLTESHLQDLGETQYAMSQACPHCQVPIQRPTGCSHMKCTHCQKDFCWTCRMSWHVAHICPVLSSGSTENDARRAGASYTVFYTSHPPPHEQLVV
jgi:hypothetical protein